MLNEVISRAPWLSKDKKNEIVREIIEGYQSGALSKEQVEEKIEEINISLTRANNPPAPGQNQKQSNSGNKIDEKTNNPQVPTQSKVENQPLAQRPSIGGTIRS